MTSLDAAVRMDRQYRYQRYVYDFSRKYYLFGRDTLLKDLPIQADDTVLEIGCGTARNLLKLAYRYPTARLHGVDASAMMLEMAKKNLQGTQYRQSIQLRQGLAEQVSWKELGLDEPLDHIIFSYVLSMIPAWPAVLEHALTLLKPQGCLHIVDFSDQAALPAWFRSSLLTWLTWFNVHPEPKILQNLEQLAERSGAKLKIQHLPGRYAFLALYRKEDKPLEPKSELPNMANYLDI
ncbi:MAG: class I SAM-dependent methyltransferase [Thiolinea sp.]|jgi:S-adenosylmethionine-diacylgycerolhomoserine-N-methlytransferase